MAHASVCMFRLIALTLTWPALISVEHPALVPLAAASEPTLEGPVHLYVPAEPDVIVPGARLVDQVENRVQVLQVVLGDHLLTVGVAHVEVRMVY